MGQQEIHAVFRQNRGLTIGFLTILLVGATSGIFVSAHANEDPSNTAAPAAASDTMAPERPTLKAGMAGSFLSSRFAKSHEDIKDSAKFLKNALEHDPDNLRLKHETMRASLLAGDVVHAIGYAKQLKDQAKADALVATLLMLDAVHEKKYAAAQQFLADAPGSGLFGVVRPLMTQWLSLASGDTTSPVDMQPVIDKAGFFAPFISYHAALMNDVLGYEKEAQANYAKASDDAGTTPYRVVEAQANFYARHGRVEEAQKLFDAYAKANPDSSLLPDKITQQGEAVKPMIANANQGLAEVFFTTASILFSDETSKDTFLYLRIALDLHPQLQAAKLMLANLYEQSGDFAQAITIYDSMEKGTVFYRRGQVRKALNLEASGKQDEAVKLLDAISMQYPNDTIALITKGDMLRVQQKYKEAAATYSDAIARSEPLKENDWPLLYVRGISFERTNQWPKAEADFQRALQLEPNQPDVLNYLAYSWLLMNKNLITANEYLDIALSARPDDAHIVDSAGLAKYLIGDYKTAADYFEKAVDVMPDDATVNEHLGDVYWRLGRQTEAKFQWTRALNAKPEESQMEAIKGKLAVGLPPLTAEQMAAAEAAKAAVKPVATAPAVVNEHEIIE